MTRIGLAVGFALGVLAGCRVSPPTATVTDASRAHLELADLQHGRSLLVSKCGNCHRPPMPADHSAREWPEKLDEMATRANLDFMQRRLIEQYLVTMAMH
jgi:hypothetical protein